MFNNNLTNFDNAPVILEYTSPSIVSTVTEELYSIRDGVLELRVTGVEVGESTYTQTNYSSNFPEYEWQ